MVTPQQAGRVNVAVVCVAGGREFVKEMMVPVGQTVGWCVNASGLWGLDAGLRSGKVGIWGKMVAGDVEVRGGGSH